MYEAVHAVPEGASTVARFASTADDVAFDGIVVRNHADSPAEYDATAIGDRYGVDVVDGVEVRAETPGDAAGRVGNRRPTTTVLLVHGGSATINRFAVENERVDVLAHPMRGNGDVNHVLARAAAENDVRLEVDLSWVLRRSGGSRVRAIAGLRKLRELIETYGAPYVVTASPSSHLQLRAPRELAAVGQEIGFSPEMIEEGLAEWGRIADRNRERRSEAFIEPGVERRPDDRSDS